MSNIMKYDTYITISHLTTIQRMGFHGQSSTRRSNGLGPTTPGLGVRGIILPVVRKSSIRSVVSVRASIVDGNILDSLLTSFLTHEPSLTPVVSMAGLFA